MICDECDQVLRAHAHDIDDAHVREQSRGGPLVDSRAANAEQLRDPADGEQSLDRRWQIGNKISANLGGSLGSLDT